MSNEYLIHHGVKGMKWGVRKDRKTSIATSAKKVISGAAKKAGSAASEKISERSEIRKTQKLINTAAKNPSKLTEEQLKFVEKRIQAEQKAQKAASGRELPSSMREAKKESLKASKNRSIISDEELNYRISRLEKEQKLKSLTNENVRPGRTAAKKILADTAKSVLITSTSKALGVSANKMATYAVNKALNKAGFDGADYVADLKGYKPKSTTEEPKAETPKPRTGKVKVVDRTPKSTNVRKKKDRSNVRVVRGLPAPK